MEQRIKHNFCPQKKERKKETSASEDALQVEEYRADKHLVSSCDLIITLKQ